MMDEMQASILMRILIAAALGMIIGFDREKSGKAAGMRTQMLVCVGSALLTGISVYLGRYYGNGQADPARLMAQIVSGIGFLGAGIILKVGNKVVGVTTAATVWIAASIGIAVGVGFYWPAILSTILVLMMNPIAYLQYRFGLKGFHYVIKVKKVDVKDVELALLELKMDTKNKHTHMEEVSWVILSSAQRNEKLEKILNDKKVIYDLELLEEQ